MSGVAAAAIAGVVFGVFQSVNRATLVEMDVLASTFIQLLVCSAFMVAVLLVQGTGAIGSLTIAAIANFATAGLIHFLAGWTLLNMSQKRLGAARTSPLIATTPLFGTAIAALTLDEIPGAVELVGVALIVAGVYASQLERARRLMVPAAAGTDRTSVRPYHDVPLRASLFGLGAALAWAVSPTFIRRGLNDVDDPVLGVMVGVIAATIGYGFILLARSRNTSLASASRSALRWKVAAGLLVGLATWTRWYALGLAPVAVVLGLALLSVPTVIVLAPIAAGRRLEPITVPVVVGSAFVVAGALVLILRG